MHRRRPRKRGDVCLADLPQEPLIGEEPATFAKINSKGLRYTGCFRLFLQLILQHVILVPDNAFFFYRKKKREPTELHNAQCEPLANFLMALSTSEGFPSNSRPSLRCQLLIGANLVVEAGIWLNVAHGCSKPGFKHQWSHQIIQMSLINRLIPKSYIQIV